MCTRIGFLLSNWTNIKKGNMIGLFREDRSWSMGDKQFINLKKQEEVLSQIADWIKSEYYTKSMTTFQQKILKL